MSTIVVSHAFGNDEHSVWYPYLREELGSQGHTVRIPNLPDTQSPRLQPWRETLAEHALATSAAETVLVGHSIGAVNVLRFLERHDVERDGTFAGVVLVGAPAHEVGYEALAEFFVEPFDWARIRQSARKFHVLAAADDPVLIPNPFEHVATHVAELSATGTILSSGGHFGAHPDDHTPVPEAIRLIRDLADDA